MMETTTNQNANIAFEKQLNGYDREQVDSYIKNLSAAYQSAYEEYTAACEKFNALLDEHKSLQAREQSRPNADVIAKTLIDTETLARKIIEEANAEAAAAGAQARADAQKIIDEARCEAQKIIDDARDEAQRIADGAYTEKAALKMQARQLIDEAYAEAASAKESAESVITKASVEAAIVLENAKKVIDYAYIEASQITTQAAKDREQADEHLRMAIEKLHAMLPCGRSGADAPQIQDKPVLVPYKHASA